MTDIVSISRININLIESPFILMNALREYNYNASGRQRTQPGDFETEFTKFVSTVNFNGSIQSLRNTVKTAIEYSEKPTFITSNTGNNETPGSTPMEKVLKKFFRSSLEPEINPQQSLIVIPNMIGSRGNLSSYKKNTRLYIEYLKSKNISVFFLNIVPDKKISSKRDIDEYSELIKEEFERLNEYIIRQFIKFEVNLKSGMDDYINSIYFFCDKDFNSLDTDLFIRGTNENKPLESIFSQYLSTKKIGKQPFKVSNIKGILNMSITEFNRLLDSLFIELELKSSFEKIPYYKEYKNIVYKFFIHVIDLKNDTFKKEYIKTVSLRPSFQVVFRRSSDPSNKDIKNSDDEFKIVKSQSHKYLLKSDGVNFERIGYFTEKLDSTGKRFTFKELEYMGDSGIYEVFKSNVSKQNMTVGLFISLAVNDKDIKEEIMKYFNVILGLNISDNDYNQLVQHSNTSTHPKKELLLEKFLIDLANSIINDTKEFDDFLKKTLLISALFQTSHIRNQKNKLFKKFVSIKEGYETENEMKILKIRIKLSQNYTIDILDSNTDNERLYKIRDMNNRTTIDQGVITKIPQKTYMDKFLATHIDLTLPDRDQIFYRDDLLITEELLQDYYQKTKPVEPTDDKSKGRKKKGEELILSRYLLRLLTDFAQLESLYEYVASDPNLSKKHILEFDIGEKKTSEFRQKTLDSLIDIIFKPGTPIYIKSREQQTVQSTSGQNIGHIMSVTRVPELSKTFGSSFKKVVKNKLIENTPEGFYFREDEKVNSRGRKIKNETPLLTKGKFEDIKIQVDKNPKQSLVVLDLVISQEYKSPEEKKQRRRECKVIKKRLKKKFSTMKKKVNSKLSNMKKYLNFRITKKFQKLLK